jgi:anti-anti-sigma factor
MATFWSDNILVADLGDEPDFSDDIGQVETELARVGPEGAMPSVILNMGDVTYVNSSNLAQLLRLRKQLVGADSKLVISGVVDAVWSVMLTTGLEKVFEFAPDKATALAGLQLSDAAE